MALITSPTLLRQDIEVVIDTTARTFTLDTVAATTNLSNDGVTLQALYSFFKEEWKNDNTLIPFPFPMVAITPEQFEFVDDWVPVDDTTRKLIRTGGWAEVATGGTLNREYVGVITLGNIDVGDTAYYAFATDSAKTDFSFDGPVNEAIQSYGDATNGDFDKRSDVLTLFIREQGKTYDQITTTDIGLSSVTYKVERFPLSEAADLKIVASDATITTDAPYNDMSITFHATPQSLAMGTNSYNFGVVVASNDGTSEQVYEYIQYQLRQDADINTGVDVVNGLLADAMAVFVGDRLDTLSATNPAGGGTGIYLAALSSTSINDVRFVDNTFVYRTFPFVAAGTINFSDTLVGDVDSVYRMFFSTNPAGNFGTATAVTVNDADDIPIAGNVSGSSSVSFSFDFDGNVQGGRTAEVAADVTVVAIGLGAAQYVAATGTIGRSTANVITLVSALERNYTD